jgi:hypothetical protein
MPTSIAQLFKKVICILLFTIIFSFKNKTDKTESLIKNAYDSLNTNINKLAEHYHTKDADIIIFSKAYCEDLPYFGNCFSPSKSEIDTCENHIIELIKHFGTFNGKHSVEKDGWDTIYRDLNLYKRQYLGFINKEKDSVLKVIAIHKSHVDSLPMWGRKFYFYEKYGQNIRWEVSFNLRKKKIIEIGGT